jgi:hypothetical protein
MELGTEDSKGERERRIGSGSTKAGVRQRVLVVSAEENRAFHETGAAFVTTLAP